MQPDVFDLVFVLTAVAFNLLIAALFVASKRKNLKLMRGCGTAWLLLSIPLVVVGIHYALTDRKTAILFAFGGVFLYMLVEWLLDYVFKIDFRSKWRWLFRTSFRSTSPSSA